MGDLDGGVDSEGATEGVLRSDFRYGGLGDVLVVQESRENTGDESIVAVI